MVASTREASTAAAARLSAEVVAERETGGWVAGKAMGGEHTMFRRRGDTRRTTWGVSTQVVSRNGTNTPLSSGRTHVATGESGRRPGWPPPGTQASRHDMNSGWTCCAEAFGPGSRRAPLRSTPPSRLSAHTRLTRAVGWPLPQPAATPGLRGHWGYHLPASPPVSVAAGEQACPRWVVTSSPVAAA